MGGLTCSSGRGTKPRMPSPARTAPAALSRPALSPRSLALFVLAAVLLRAAAVVAWMFFPGTSGFQQLARIMIPLGVAAGLLALNLKFLRRDGLSADALGLGWRKIGWFVAGGLAAVAVIFAIAGVLWLFVPFHWERGTLSFSRYFWQAAEYTAGNSGEELMFRGYLLLILARALGMRWALLVVAILFGMFHLPGLSGGAALKMICTTGIWSYLFAFAFLLTKSLWAAIGLHVFGNLLLHQTLGLSGGESLWRVVLHSDWPTAYDPAFLTSILVSLLFVLFAARWFHHQGGSRQRRAATVC